MGEFCGSADLKGLLARRPETARDDSMGKRNLSWDWHSKSGCRHRLWQILSREIANLELQTDMRDVPAQVVSRIGLEVQPFAA
jgi:hypothetical protein